MTEVAPRETSVADPETTAATAVARRGRGWSGVIVALAAFVMAGALAAVLVVLRLSSGPLELAWLRDRVADAIERQLGEGLDVSVGKATVERAGQGVEIHLREIVVATRSGRRLVHAPDSTVTFDTPSLLTGTLRPVRLSFREIDARVEIGPDGQVRLTASGEPVALPSDGERAEGGAAGALLSAVAGLARGEGLTGGLREIAVEDSRLTVDDRRAGRQIVHDGFALHVRSRNRLLALEASARRQGRQIALAVEAEPEAGDVSRLTFRLGNLAPADLFALAGLARPDWRLDGTIDVSGEARFSAGGELAAARLETRAAAATIGWPGLGSEPLAIDRLRFAAIWPGGAAPVRLETAFEGGGTRLALAGPVEPSAGGWRYTASGEGLQLGATAERSAVTLIDRADVILGLSSTKDRVEIERISVRGPETDLSLVGTVTLAAEGPALSGTVRAGAMPIPALLRYWPPFVASAARSFFVGSMNKGKVLRYQGSADLTSAALAAALRQEPLPAETVHFEASVEEATLLPGHGLPPLSGAVIEARGDAVSAEGRLSRGEVALRSGRVLQLSDGAFTLAGLETVRPTGRFRFRAQGPFEAAVEFVETPSIRSHAPLPFGSAEVRGRFDGQIGLTFPLVEKLDLKDVVLDMTAGITSAAIDEVFGKDSLEQASLTVRVDRSGMITKGEGRWSGTPVQIEVKARAGQTAEALLSMTLDDQARERRGLRLGKELTGPVPVRIIADASAGEGLSARIEADLSRAAIDGLVPGLQKAAGRPARLSLQVEQRRTGYELGNILFEAGPTLLRGNAELAPDGSVVAARFPQFRLSPGDSARVEFDRAGAAGGRIVVRGQNLDARPFLRKAQQAGPPSGPDGGEVDINIKSTLLSGFGGEILTNAEVKLKRRAGRLREATVTGRLGSSAVNIRSEEGADGPIRVILDVRDAGAFLRFLDVYGRMEGGRMVGDLYPSPRGFGAVVNIRDFVLRNEPAIRRLVAEAPQGAADPRAGTAAFTKLRAELDRIGPETRLKEAVIFGPQFGLTLQGTTDAARDRISMSGTFVPAYGLNNVFAQVPLVGTILGGGRNEGLLGLTFSLTGRASQPTVQVNPLSAITPGIFRRIFEFPNDARERVPDALLYREQGRSGAN